MIYALLVAHFVGDFICQSDWMALNKSKRWDALALHVAAYAVVLFVVVLWIDGYRTRLDVGPWLRTVALYVGINAAAHFVQDAITSRINARLWFIDGIRVKPNIGTAGGSSLAALAPCFEVAYNDKRHWFFVGIGADQLLHYLTLVATAEWLLR